MKSLFLPLALPLHVDEFLHLLHLGFYVQVKLVAAIFVKLQKSIFKGFLMLSSPYINNVDFFLSFYCPFPLFVCLCAFLSVFVFVCLFVGKYLCLC